MEKLAKLPFTTGNDAELLVDGDATFQSIFEGITKAEKYVLVQSYIIQDDEVGRELKTRLLERAKAGVPCYLLYDEIADNLLVQYSAWSYLEALQKTGIKVYRYTRGFMHHKVVVVDDTYCTVGTANFDNRSFRLNFEITMAFSDRDFTRQVTAMLENDFSNARLVRPGELQEHGFWFRLAVQAARLTAPVQ